MRGARVLLMAIIMASKLAVSQGVTSRGPAMMELQCMGGGEVVDGREAGRVSILTDEGREHPRAASPSSCTLPIFLHHLHYVSHPPLPTPPPYLSHIPPPHPSSPLHRPIFAVPFFSSSEARACHTLSYFSPKERRYPGVPVAMAAYN